MLYNATADSTAQASFGYESQRHAFPEAQRYQSSGMQRSTSQDGPPLASESLLKGHKIVEIVHNGSLYKLQATKLGKLILTK